VLWTAGVAAPELATVLAKATGAEQDHSGRVVVSEDLTIPGHPEISVVGDTMSLHKLPGVAEVAMQSGRYTGRRIRHELVGRPVKPFKYRDLGLAAYVARGDAVVSTGPLKFSGFIGWVIWLVIHAAYLSGFRNRVGTILSWWVTFTRDNRRERVFTSRQVGRMPTVYGRANGQAGQPPASQL
jgi:NADH:ubiquinone reductase (H+-translocating)